MARHLPDRRGEAEDRAGSRAREASRAAAGGPGRGAARRPRRRAERAAPRPGLPRSRRPRPRAWRGACARSARASTRDTPSSPAPRADGARSAAWRDGRCDARGRRGQAMVDAKARLGDRASAALRRLRGRRNLFGDRASRGPGGRSGRPLAPHGARDTAEPRQAKPRAWPASGRGAARPGGRPRPQGRDAPGLHGT